MKIDSATIGMESARSYRASSKTVRRFSITEYQDVLKNENNALNTAIGGEDGQRRDTWENDTDSKERSVDNIFSQWQTSFKPVGGNVHIRNTTDRVYSDIRENTIRYIFELLVAARRERLYPESFSPNIRVIHSELDTFYEEQETTSFSTTGTVRTGDGREISFQVNLEMSRDFQASFKEDLKKLSFPMCDPLVINLDTDVAQVLDQTFYFDIDADGKEDEISMLNTSSGYLALDKNEDGKINDGSELFGTKSGNGFSDLSKYDEDGNGWIDENDSVWEKLKIWTRDENGKEILYRLSEKGVGAICLQNCSTDFAQKNQKGQTIGAIRYTGFFLYENGNAGTVQHVDVAKLNTIAE